MSTSFTWTINNLERRVDDGYVLVAHWDCLAKNADEVGRAYGSTSFFGELDVPFADLTEEVVVGWIKNVEDEAAIEASAQAALDAKLNPPVVSGLPW